ncbi:MAG: hypothetical protein AB7D57_13635 [Desulfovibrionaceae bacterium]
MGVHFLPGADHRLVYWYFHGLVTAEQSLAEQARAARLGDFSDWLGEFIFLEPDTEFHRDMYSRFDEMRPRLRELFPRLPPVSAAVCSPVQMTSLPGFWHLVTGRSRDIFRRYEIFTELEPAVLWLKGSPDEVRADLERMRAAALRPRSG